MTNRAEQNSALSIYGHDEISRACQSKGALLGSAYAVSCARFVSQEVDLSNTSKAEIVAVIQEFAASHGAKATPESARISAINAAIISVAEPMGAAMGPAFAFCCARILYKMTDLLTASQSEIDAAIQTLAEIHREGAKRERDRVLAIDALAAQLPPGNEAAARTAKFETRISAEAFAEQVLQSHKLALGGFSCQQRH